MATDFSAKVDFQKATSPVFPGYVADVGRSFAARNGFSYGWSSDNRSSARDRDAANSPDERYDTWVKTAGKFWEIAVPNGTYSVRVVAGDPTTFDSYYKVNIEGTLAIDFQPTSAQRWADQTINVNVTDGRLTLSNAAGSIDNKICFIEITGADAEPGTPPAAPSGTAATGISDTQVRVTWNDNSTDESGFRIYRKLGSGGTYALVHETTPGVTQYDDGGLTPETQYFYKVLAFNGNGESAFSNEDGGTTLEGSVGQPPVGSEIDWDQVASSPIKRAEANGTVVNGKLYVFGGLFFNGSDIVATPRSDVYNPATNTWTRIADQPVAMTHSPAVVVGETIWFIGGYVGDHPGPGTKQVWKYNTATNAWSRGPDLPNSRGAGGAALLNNKIHFFGGMGYDRTWESSSHWVLDLGNQAAGWQSRASLPNPRNHVAGIAVGGYVYAIGGQHGQEENQVAQDDIHRYDPTTNTWTHVADLPTGRSHITAAVVQINGKIIILGGETGDAANVRDVTMYDPQTNTFTEMTQLPLKRSTGVAGVLNDGRLIYATGNAPAETAEAWIGTIL